MTIYASVFACLILCGAPARRQSILATDPFRSLTSSAQSAAAEAIRPVTGMRRVGVVVADSGEHHMVLRSLIAVAAGGILGGVLANQYAQAHRPPCLPTPAGFCVRDSDHSNVYRAIGIGVGASTGWFVSVRLTR